MYRHGPRHNDLNRIYRSKFIGPYLCDKTELEHVKH